MRPTLRLTALAVTFAVVPPAEGVAEARQEIDRRALEHGRDPEKIPITAMIGAPPGLETPSLDTLPGRDVAARYAEAGADRIVVSLPTLDADGTRRHLDAVVAARA